MAFVIVFAPVIAFADQPDFYFVVVGVLERYVECCSSEVLLVLENDGFFKASDAF